MLLMSLLNLLKYLGVTFPLMLIGTVIFTLTTPYHEFDILFDGDQLEDPKKVAAAKAVAMDLGGKVIGLALLLSSVIYHSANILDLTIWAIVGMFFLILVYFIFEVLTPKIKIRQEISNGNIGVAMFSFCLSFSTGLLMAALIS
jgi:Predicted membrane protein